MKKISKFIINLICTITLIVIILGTSYVVQITIMNKKYANVLGYSLFEVLTGSMLPTINIGDDVFVKISKDINKGDIVVFDNVQNNNFILHRVVQINENEVITKGDNNNTADTAISKEDIIGKVLIIFPKLGKIQEFFRKPYVFIPLVDVIVISTLLLNYKKNIYKNKYLRGSNKTLKKERNILIWQKLKKKVTQDIKS